MPNSDQQFDPYLQQDRAESASTSSSLVARAGQILAVIVALGLISMISSMLVSESLSGDAAQINRAGALRMQAMRISRAHLADETQRAAILKAEIAAFEDKLGHLFSGGLTSALEDEKINAQFQVINNLWQPLKSINLTAPNAAFDEFVVSIDRLVTLLQLHSEEKLSILRSIQGASLLAVLVVASFVLFKLHRQIIQPLKQLVFVAAQAGQGNFGLKAQYDADDELGVLAKTINQMSAELASIYAGLEDRVDLKTRELMRSNQSLEILYQAARNLATEEPLLNVRQIVSELEQALGFGHIQLALVDTRTTDETQPKVTPDNPLEDDHRYLEFPLQKQDKQYGQLIWRLSQQQVVEEWQHHLLQAMADIIATAIQLQDNRITQNRLMIVEERAVIARELHDSLAQSLSYLKVQVGLLNRKVQKQLPVEQLNETIEDIKRGLNGAYLQLRELLTTFRLKLEDPSIYHALKGTVSEFTAKCQHPVELDFQLPKNFLSANQEIHVLQIVREALSNVQRHANAKAAGVQINHNDNKISVAVWDDGKGMPKAFDQHGHFGLAIMEERARSLNALIDLQPNTPQGTRVCVAFERQEN